MADWLAVMQEISARRKCPLHQNPEEKGWVPSRVEDFLATDQERERCREILIRSTLGLWDEPKVSKGQEDQICSSGIKRAKVERCGLWKVQRRRVEGESGERSVEWE